MLRHCGSVALPSGPAGRLPGHPPRQAGSQDSGSQGGVPQGHKGGGRHLMHFKTWRFGMPVQSHNAGQLNPSGHWKLTDTCMATCRRLRCWATQQHGPAMIETYAVHYCVTPSRQRHHPTRQPPPQSSREHQQLQVRVQVAVPHQVLAQALHRPQGVQGQEVKQGQEGHAPRQVVLVSSSSSGRVSNIASSSQLEAGSPQAAGPGQLPSVQAPLQGRPATGPVLSACMPATSCCGRHEQRHQGR
jgi:hypothetical protein